MVSLKDARGHYWWFHLRIPGGNKEHQPLALYQFRIYVHLPSRLCFEKVRAPWSVNFVLLRFWVDSFKDSTKVYQFLLWRPWSYWKINTLSYDDSYPRKIWLFNRKVNIIYQVTYIKYCIESIKRNLGLFATLKCLAIFAQVEFQLKK